MRVFQGNEIKSREMQRKRDRMARLLRLQIMLLYNPDGLEIKILAHRLDVSIRTVYRDLIALESEMGVPIWEDGSRRGITEGYALPPIPFTLLEALNIFLAARLMINYSRKYDPNMASTFGKLLSVVPLPLREQVKKTIPWIHELPRNEKYLRTLAVLAEAWTSLRRVRISYQSLGSEQLTERIIEPYFIEPEAPGHSCYVIAYCHLALSLRTFKLERIEEIYVTSETYVIPPDFDINDYLGSSWGIVVDGEITDIKLRFASDVARIIEETIWHPSQVLEPQEDGSLIMKIRVTDTVDFHSWILGWGHSLEVLEPAELRNKIADAVSQMMDIYR